MQRQIPLRCAVRECVTITILRTDSPRARLSLGHAGVTFSDAMHDEGYVILSEGRAINVIAATSAGVFYGVQTIKQLVKKAAKKPTLVL